MQTRTLGPFKVSALGLGCMGMSMAYGPTDDAESLRALRHAIDRGVTLFDSSDFYGAGHNETLIGQAVKGRRAGLVIGTKFGLRRTETGVALNGRPDYVTACCDASLQRLGIDCIDLYYQHRVDPHVPIEETVGAMAALVAAGKVRALGLSEAAPATIRRAHAVHPIAGLQTEYSLWSRDVEDDILATCRELGIGFVAYAPLGRGFLAGTLHALADIAHEKDARPKMPRFEPENFPANKALADALAAWARDRGWTAAQVALAWLLAQGRDIVPIPGTRNIARLDENLGAANIALSDEDLRAIEKICPRGAAAGARASAGVAARNTR
jgi:aryl-alcohol dehydrogenase-like predicted oxidoreductase